jgi:hypothetical protein
MEISAKSSGKNTRLSTVQGQIPPRHPPDTGQTTTTPHGVVLPAFPPNRMDKRHVVRANRRPSRAVHGAGQ